MRDVAKLLFSRGVSSCSFSGSVMLLELLRARKTPATIKQGYLAFGPKGMFSVWHVWVESHGAVLDVGTEVAVLALRSRGQDVAVFENAEYSQAPDEGKIRVDKETYEGKQEVAVNEVCWAEFRENDIDGTYWNADAAPQNIRQLRAEVMNIFMPKK